jgi:hypothetical protein
MLSEARSNWSDTEWRLSHKPEHWAKLAALVSALSYAFNFSRANILQGRCRGISSPLGPDEVRDNVCD